MSDEKGEKSGKKLLSKVIQFVTNPTTDWRKLEDPDGIAAESSTRALKAMIARKRRNEFVRDREFESLRRLMKKGEIPVGAMPDTVPHTELSRPVPPSVEGSRGASAAGTSTDTRGRLDRQLEKSWRERMGGGRESGARTEPVPVDDPATGGTSPMPAPAEDGPPPRSKPPVLHDTLPLQRDAAHPASPATQPVPEPLKSNVPRVGPSLEEAVFLYADGDGAAAEAALLHQIDETPDGADELQVWNALFDLYRLSGETRKYHAIARRFSEELGRSPPSSRFTDIDGPGEPRRPDAEGGDAAGQPAWSAPALLDAAALSGAGALLTQRGDSPRLDWSGVKTVAQDALPALVDMLHELAEQPLRLEFLGVRNLLAVLERQTVLQQRDVDENWWLARLGVLRVLNRPEEFDETALAYCVTYELSPPAWADPACQCTDLENPREAGARKPVQPVSTSTFLPSDLTSGATSYWPPQEAAARLVLGGEILGEAKEALAPLVLDANTEVIECDCRRLTRVDFGAAGALLNWVIEQKGAGRQVVFRDVNRLVASFFAVIGIAGEAVVLQRSD